MNMLPRLPDRILRRQQRTIGIPLRRLSLHEARLGGVDAGVARRAGEEARRALRRRRGRVVRVGGVRGVALVVEGGGRGAAP